MIRNSASLHIYKVLALPFLVALIIFSCTAEPSWSPGEKVNADHFFKSLEADAYAIRILSSLEAGVGSITDKDFKLIRMYRTTALEEARLVSDIVLDKAHSSLKKHWRDEYQRGLALFLQSYGTSDYSSQLESQILLDSFTDWFNSNNHKIKIPKNR